MPKITWLALGYNVPIHPSKNRVYVWRKLKEWGAGYFKQGVAILPKSQQNMAKFRQLAAKIKDMDGEATIVELKFCDARDEAETIERFRSQSVNEYEELLHDCAQVMEGLRKNLLESAIGKDSLKKMRRRYKQAQERDYFLSGQGEQMADILDELAEDIGKLF